MGEVTELRPTRKANTVLEEAKDVYEDLIIVGWTKDGQMEARASHGLADGGNIIWLIEQFKLTLLTGDFHGEE